CVPEEPVLVYDPEEGCRFEIEFGGAAYVEDACFALSVERLDDKFAQQAAAREVPPRGPLLLKKVEIACSIHECGRSVLILWHRSVASDLVRLPGREPKA